MSASDTFSQILMRKAGAKNINNSKVEADIESVVIAKGLSLKATFEARLKEDVPEDQLEDIALAAASERVDDLLEDFISDDFLDSSSYGRVRTNKVSRKKVNLPLQVFGLRRKSGTFVSGLQLSRQLNIILYEYVQKNMGRDGRLNNDTGRFAHSVHIDEISSPGKTSESQLGDTSIMFSYMVRPYEVFEKNTTFNNGGLRSPDKLIRVAIRQAILQGLKDWLNDSSVTLASGFKLKGV